MNSGEPNDVDGECKILRPLRIESTTAAATVGGRKAGRVSVKGFAVVRDSKEPGMVDVLSIGIALIDKSDGDLLREFIAEHPGIEQ